MVKLQRLINAHTLPPLKLEISTSSYQEKRDVHWTRDYWINDVSIMKLVRYSVELNYEDFCADTIYSDFD